MNNQPIVIKSDEDVKAALTPIVTYILKILKSEELRIDLNKPNKYGRMAVVIDAETLPDNDLFCEVMAEILNELDPYDLKGVVFDELLFDIDRPTWLDEHTSRAIDVTTGDGMGPYNEDPNVESCMLLIDLDKLAEFYVRINFMRCLVNELRYDINDAIIKTQASDLIGDGEFEESFILTIHQAAGLFNRTVKYIHHHSEAITVFLNPSE